MDNHSAHATLESSECDIHSVGDSVVAGSVTYTFEPLVLTRSKVDWLWANVDKFRMAWDDYTVISLSSFCDMLIDRRNVFFEMLADGRVVGLLSLMNVRPGHTANFHAVFWDRVFAGRHEAVHSWIASMTRELKLRRIAAFVPETNRPAWKFARRVGLKIEGLLHGAGMHQGRYVNVIALGALTEGLFDGK